jgi:hypothetical protein
MHVAWLKHETEATLCCAWYVDPVQTVQLVDLVSNANPAAQYLQLSPSKVVKVWYCPSAQLEHARFAMADGVLPYVPATQVEYVVHVTDATALFD